MRYLTEQAREKQNERDHGEQKESTLTKIMSFMFFFCTGRPIQDVEEVRRIACWVL